MNDLSRGIRMWAQISFVLSQITRSTDRQDRWTDQQLYCNLTTVHAMHAACVVIQMV